MVKYEPPYVVHMIESTLSTMSAEKGVVYSTGNPGDAEAFASGKEFSDKRPWRVGRRVWRRPDGTWEG